MAIQFYERVQILTCRDQPDLIGRHGWVLGMSFEDDTPEMIQGYSVHEIDGTDGLGFVFLPGEIEGTGEVADQSWFYPDSEARVRVRNVNGRGYLVEGD